MKNPTNLQLSFGIMIIVLISCNKSNENSDEFNITYHSVDREYVLIRDLNTLIESDDEISNHIDSILAGLLDEEFISTGHKDFNLDSDEMADIAFEIIDLNNFNPEGLPDTFDSLAARVIPLGVEILDNSTYGYPDALKIDSKISEEGNWSDRTGVLGTFQNGGQFQGNGEQYLGFRFMLSENYNYGWIKIYCSQHNDTLRIIDYAFNKISGGIIYAGQKE
jgi:hypothetical protein